MRTGGGKSKGNRFENQVARSLSLWVTGGRDATQLIPTRLSGGWRPGQRGPEAWRQVGDLAPNGPAGDLLRAVFGVECKHHRVIEWWDIWKRPAAGNTLLGWYRRLEKDCAAAGDLHPLVIFRSNFKPIMAAYPMGAVEYRTPPRGMILVPAYKLEVVPFTDLLVSPKWELAYQKK